MIFNCIVVSTHYSCICIIVLITLKKATSGRSRSVMTMS